MANEVMWLTPPFYTATRFDGTTTITHSGTLGSIANGQLGLFSFWLKMDASSNDSSNYNILLFDSSNSVVRLIRDNLGGIRIFAKNPTFGDVIDVTGDHGLITASNGWHHVMVTYDLGSASNQNIYIDGVSHVAGVGTFDWGANTSAHQVGYAVAVDCSVSSGAIDPLLMGSLSELYFQTPATYFTDTTKFRSASGFPVPLGSDGSLPTGVQPFIYLPNPFTSFGTNSGSGGNFTTTAGALLNAPSIPP